MENAQTAAIIEQLHKKLALLEQISANTNTMVRFARQRKLTGLLRLLRERETDLEALMKLNAALSGSLAVANKRDSALEALLAKIKRQERELGTENAVLMKAANETRKAIGDDVRRVQEQRKVRKQYDLQDIKMSGRRINCYK